MTPRVVLDTNVVLSALLFLRGRLTWIRHAWSRGAFRPLVSGATTQELIRVLAYPKFELTPEEIETLLSDYLPFAEVVRDVRVATEELPDPPDPDDRVFLALALAGGASCLVTGDVALQEMQAPSGLAVISPAAFRRMIQR